MIFFYLITGSDIAHRRQNIIWSNAGLLLIWPLENNFIKSGIVIEIHVFSFTKMHLKMAAGKWRPFSLSLSVLNEATVSPI